MFSRLIAPVLLVTAFAACSSPTYTVGGTVTGLAGTGLVLQNDGTNNLTITKDGPFTLPGTLASKTPYFVTVLTQPGAPAQTCTVASAQGSVVGANITNVAVTCTTGTYAVGGTVTGLAGSGLVLQDNGGDSLTVAANGSFSFATPLANGAAYAVTVMAQPTTPTQTCAVTSGTGTIGTSPVTSVAVACTTTTFTVGGSITGLLGTGLVLEDNGGDDLTITSGETFAFATPVASGAPFSVTVTTQPTGPSQTCTVAGGSGTVGSGNVSSIMVNCSTTTVTVGGVVTGLTGSGLVLQNNGADNLKVTSNGLFAFPTAVASGAAYAVTVSAQPASPTQTCTVAGGTGTVATGSVTSVVVTCSTNTYALSGTIMGLKGTGLVLQDNGGDNIAVTPSMTTFAFATSLASGATYSIAVSTQPTGPSQTCVVSTDASGMITDAAVTDIAVTCTTNNYAVGGTVAGLAGGGLVLENNGGDNLKVTGNGAFTFAKTVASAGTFDVTVQTQPSMPSQTCVVTGGSGEVVGSAIGTVTVNCSTNEYTVSGTVTGLVGTGLALSLNGAAGIQMGMNGKFSFPTTLLNGATYSVAVASQPTSPAQTCTLMGATGTITAANVSNVDVSCGINNYPITVNVTGVAGSGLVLQDNGGDDLAVTASGGYTFMTLVASGSPYAVTVSTQPSAPTQTCTVANGAGTVAGAAVSNVTVSCTTNGYSVGGTITGLAGTVVIQDNASDTLIETGSSAPISFTFAANVASGAPYAITVSQQPGSPSQTCTVTNDPSGTIGTAAVTDVAITCTTNTYSLSGTVVGLVGTGLVVADDAGDSVSVSQNGVISFPTPYASGASYTISVATQPTGPAQTCAVLGGTGTVGTSNVTGITVNCSTNLYTISGSVAGLLGSGLVLADNLGDTLPISGNGTYSLPTSYASGAVYSVTVQAQPTSPSQTCTAAAGTASGTIGTTNITNVNFTCVVATYSVSVNVNGLIGGGLQLADNASDALTVTQNGLSTFATPVASQKTYAVTVLNQPSAPSQTCSVANGSGTIVGSNVTIAVTCTTNTYAVSVTVTGLAGTGLKFWNNGGNGLSVTANGTFPFTTAIASGGVYDVTVLTQPSGPTQVCTVTSPSGTIAAAPVTLAVACVTSSFTVGGTITGLGGGSVVLQNNTATTTLTVSANGTFQFPTAVASSGTYAVTVQTQPSAPTQTCSVTNGSGTVTTAAITNIAVACTTTSYTVGGTISGLTGTGLVLQLNGANNLTVAAAATTFTFTTSVASGAAYTVTVATPPSSPTETCVITSGTGTVGAANVSNISIACTATTYTVGGVVVGLGGGTLVLQDNLATNKLSISTNGAFSFPAAASGSAYAVTVQTAPTSPSEGCVITNGSGTIANANVTNVFVVCTTANYTVGGTITGLTGAGTVLQLNGANNLTVAAASTSFVFATSLASSTAYTVTVSTQPTTPTQTCTVTNGTGTVTEANITNVAIACTTNTYSIQATVSGLSASASVVLQDNGANNLTFTTNTTQSFTTQIASGATYSVTVLTQPTSQYCTVTNGSGTVVSANVTNITVACVVSGCGRFSTGVVGTSWSTATFPSAFSSGGISFTDITPLGAGGFFDNDGSSFGKWTESTAAFTTLASSPVSFSDWNGGAWATLNNIYWLYAGDVYTYSISANAWTTLLTGTVSSSEENDNAHDLAGNVYTIDSNDKVLKYNITSNTATELTPSVAFSAQEEPHVAWDDCTNLLYVVPAYYQTAMYSFNPATNVSVQLASIPDTQISDGFCGDNSGHLYAAGSYSGSQFWQYTIATNTWTKFAATSPSADANCGACTVGDDGNLYYTGGCPATSLWHIALE